MDLELLVIRDCPHQTALETLLRQALADLGLAKVAVTTTVITSEYEAKQRLFVGSPTVLIDGHDPFAKAGQPPSLACRIYQNPNGPSGTPDLGDLRRALNQAAERNRKAADSP